MEASHFRKEIWLFIIIYSVSRIFLLFIPASPPDIPYLSMKVEDVVSGTNLPYPPLFQFQLALFLLLFGQNLFGYRIGMILYEVGFLFFLYKFVYRFQRIEFKKKEQDAANTTLKIIYIVAFFPNTIFIYSGSVEFVASFFMIIGLYEYYKSKLSWSSFFFCLGFLMEFYPIFCLIPIIIHLLLSKEFKKTFLIFGVFLATFILINLPFFIINPENSFSSYMIQFSRPPNAVSLWKLLYEALPTWNIISVFGLITLSPVGLTLILACISYGGLSFVFFRKNQKITRPQEFLLIFIFIALLPLVFLSIFPRYIFMGLPILCLFFESREDLPQIRNLAYKVTAIIIGTSLFTILSWPEINFLTVESDISSDSHYLLYITILFFSYFLLSLIWFNSGEKIQFWKRRQEKLTIVQLITLSFLMLFIQVVLAFNNVLFFIAFIIGILPIIFAVHAILVNYFRPNDITIKD